MELQALRVLQNQVHSQWSSTEREEGPGGDGRGSGSVAARGGRAPVSGVGVRGGQGEVRDSEVGDPL